jgi:hypothetical protein
LTCVESVLPSADALVLGQIVEPLGWAFRLHTQNTINQPYMFLGKSRNHTQTLIEHRITSAAPKKSFMLTDRRSHSEFTKYFCLPFIP